MQYIKFFGETDEIHELGFVFEQLVEELGRLKVSINKALDRFEALDQRKKDDLQNSSLKLVEILLLLIREMQMGSCFFDREIIELMEAGDLDDILNLLLTLKEKENNEE